MPTYDYRCPECSHRFEQYRPMTAPDTDCPICGKKAIRLISAGSGFLFRGSGFYATDYRSNEYKERTKRERKKAI